MSIITKFLGTCVALSLAMMVFSSNKIKLSNDEALELPISFTENKISHGEFMVRHDDKYGVILRIEPHYTSNVQIPFEKETCDIEWEVLSSGSKVASGTTKSPNYATYCSSYAHRSGSFHVGSTFKANTDKKYQLKVTGKGTNASLENYRPKVIVKSVSTQSEYWFGMYYLFGWVPLIISGTLFLVWICFIGITHRTNR